MSHIRTLEELREEVRRFVDERDWAQFHSPKDLAVGMAVESGELLEVFQWKDPRPGEIAKDERLLSRVRDEVADVAIYAVLLADALGFDLGEAIEAKLRKNRERYPAEKARGKAAKYTEL